LYWSVRRELWENRWLYLAPIAAATLFLIGFLITGAHHVARQVALAPMQQQEAIQQPYNITAAVIMGIAFIIGLFYSVDALYGERRDRSILFWKSLPVSDVMTVLAKVSIPALFIPLLSFVLTLATHWLMLLISSAVLAANGMSVAAVWGQLGIFQMAVQLLYHLLTMHVLGWAPFYGWLFFVSAWARRAPLVWAIVPPLVIAGVEKGLFHTSHFVALLQRLFEGSGLETVTAPGDFPMGPMVHFTPFRFLGSPGLWIGLVIATAFLYAAVQLRRRQGPI
jgi:ABC-2 type transport system permease protein